MSFIDKKNSTRVQALTQAIELFKQEKDIKYVVNFLIATYLYSHSTAYSLASAAKWKAENMPDGVKMRTIQDEMIEMEERKLKERSSIDVRVKKILDNEKTDAQKTTEEKLISNRGNVAEVVED